MKRVYIKWMLLFMAVFVVIEVLLIVYPKNQLSHGIRTYQLRSNPEQALDKDKSVSQAKISNVQKKKKESHKRQFVKEPRSPSTLNRKKVKHRGIAETEITELSNLVREKLAALKQSGLLMEMEKQNVCRPHDAVNTVCIDRNCSSALPSQTSPQTIRSIRKPVHIIGLNKLDDTIRKMNLTVGDKKKYVFVTGASSNHFAESQLLIRSLHEHVFPFIKNFSFYYYDLGLNKTEKQLVRELSRAKLMSMPLDLLHPRTQRLTCYTWKPLIVHAHLLESEFVVWVDASIRFTEDIRPYFKKTEKTGILINNNKFQMPQHTSLTMFTYFGDHPCQYSSYKEIESGFIVLHNEPFVRRLLMEPWSACAQDPNCMCPPMSKHLFRCALRTKRYGKCHRYDQSLLGMVLVKLMKGYLPSVLTHNHTFAIKRQEKGSYFAELKRKQQIKD